MESSQKLLEWNDSINQEGNDVFSFEQRLNLFISFVISSTLFKTFCFGRYSRKYSFDTSHLSKNFCLPSFFNMAGEKCFVLGKVLHALQFEGNLKEVLSFIG